VFADVRRLDALRASGLLVEHGSAPVLARAARLAARALHAPVAQVNLITDTEQWPVAAHAEPPRATRDWAHPVPHARSFCRFVVVAGEPLSIPDARVHPLVMHNPATVELGIVGYLSVPVTVPAADGGAPVTLGTVCVVDMVPRAWTASDVAILEDLATAAVDEIVGRTAARTAVQVAERQMARLLAASGEGVLGTDAHGRTTFVNRRPSARSAGPPPTSSVATCTTPSTTPGPTAPRTRRRSARSSPRAPRGVPAAPTTPTSGGATAPRSRSSSR
jgi:PAS domain-containing protein